MKRLENKIILVTGAADGIGLAISKVFAQHGATVIMADLNYVKALQESSNINSQGGQTHPFECNVGSTQSVEKMIANVISEHTRIDVLVNNAAVAISGNIIEMPEEDWDTVMNVNLKSVFRTIKACLPHMLERQYGCIINMSSAQAFRSWQDWTAYAGAKGAILSMTNQLAGQFGEQNIRVNSISPGAISTPLNDLRVQKEGDVFLEKSRKMSPANRLGDADEVAMTALFLASDEALFINGIDIKVDGGLCAVPRYEEDQNDL